MAHWLMPLESWVIFGCTTLNFEGLDDIDFSIFVALLTGRTTIRHECGWQYK
jgi:hypothetical protein